jgi:hypothetical protein
VPLHLGVKPDGASGDYFDPFPLAHPPTGSFAGYGLPVGTRERISKALTQFLLWNRRGGAARRPVLTAVGSCTSWRIQLRPRALEETAWFHQPLRL